MEENENTLAHPLIPFFSERVSAFIYDSEEAPSSHAQDLDMLLMELIGLFQDSIETLTKASGPIKHGVISRYKISSNIYTRRCLDPV